MRQVDIETAISPVENGITLFDADCTVTVEYSVHDTEIEDVAIVQIAFEQTRKTIDLDTRIWVARKMVAIIKSGNQWFEPLAKAAMNAGISDQVYEAEAERIQCARDDAADMRREDRV